MSARTADSVRVLYSFPHKIGAERISNTSWQQVAGIAGAGADVLVFPGVVHRALPAEVSAKPTLARGRLRIPYKVLGHMRAFELHDRIVARRLARLSGGVDIVHTWPLAARETLRVARKLGIPSVLERPNAHTRFAYEVVGRECERLGVDLPPDHEHAFKADVLAKEEEEYDLADHLLCPSEFVARTFRDEGFPDKKLARHHYGFDESVFYSTPREPSTDRGLTMLFVGVAAVRKGLHFALEAWLRSPASEDGTFLIAGGFVPAYEEKLAPLLAHPSVEALGHRTDVADLMRRSDVFVLPSIEEGFPLAVAEARGSGCVPLVSDACDEACTHMENALVHEVGDVDDLADHITLLHRDRTLLEQLRAASLQTAHEVTWGAAGERLVEVYREILASRATPSRSARSRTPGPVEKASLSGT